MKRINLKMYHDMTPESQEELKNKYYNKFKEIRSEYSNSLSRKKLKDLLSITDDVSTILYNITVYRVKKESEPPKYLGMITLGKFKGMTEKERTEIKTKVRIRIMELTAHGLKMIEAEYRTAREMNISISLIQNLSMLAINNKKSYNFKRR